MEGRKNKGLESLYERWTGLVSEFFTGMTVKERFLALSGFALTGIVSYFATKSDIPFPPYLSNLSDLFDTVSGGISKPLGDALLCASGWTAPAAFLGVAYALYTDNVRPFSRIVSLILLFILRTVIGVDLKSEKNENGIKVGKSGKRGFLRIRERAYNERITVKIGVSAAFSLLTVLMRLPSVSITADTLTEILIMLLATPILTALLSGAFEVGTMRDTVNLRILPSVYREISVYALLILAVYSFKGHTFMGTSLATVSAIFLTVVTAVKGGVGRGGLLGAVLGYVVSTAYAPVMTAVGLFAGILGGLGIAATVGISCAVGCIIAVYVYGYRPMLNYIPESIIAAAIASPVIRYDFLGDGFPIPKKRISGRMSAEADRKLTGKRKCAADLHSLSEAFRKLSQPWTEKNDRERYPDAEGICRRLKNGFCDSCPLVCICWDKSEKGHSNTFNAVKTRISQIYSRKNSDFHDISDTDQSSTDEKSGKPENGFRCLRSDALNREIIRLCESYGAKREMLSSPLGFFGDCLYISEALSDLSESEKDNGFDPEATAKLKKAVSSVGITADGVAVFGERIKTAVIYGVNADRGSVFEATLERIARAVSEKTGCVFKAVSEGNGCNAPRLEEERKGKITLTFSSVPAFTVSYACSQRKASGETVNGDSADGFETDNGYFYSVLCDGMGSGDAAAKCSENAVNTLKTLLCCRLSPALSAKLTGDAVKDGCEECFTTLDLLAVDVTSGDASVLKSGATPSYLLRGNEVRIFNAPSLPLGLANGTVPEKIDLRLKDGDIFVTVSDGVAEEESDEQWLSQWLSDHSDTLGEPLSDIAEQIMSAAEKRKAPGNRRDDMTVSVARFTRRQ